MFGVGCGVWVWVWGLGLWRVLVEFYRLRTRYLSVAGITKQCPWMNHGNVLGARDSGSGADVEELRVLVAG